MTETDATKRPIEMPERFVPYLEKHRLYKLFKDMVKDLILNLPKDHLKHMKQFLGRFTHGYKETNRVIILVSPLLNIDTNHLVKDMIKNNGFFVITRRCILDRYEQHDDYVPGCISPALMSTVTKGLVAKTPVLHAGWVMFDHPCTVREARCLQQDGVLPTVTLVLIPTPKPAPISHDLLTPSRSFFDQDFEGLKFAYKATLKEVYIDSDDTGDVISSKCCNAIRACTSGAQSSQQGHHVVGAPGVYRVLIIGPTGSGRTTQAYLLSKHFGLVYLHYNDLLNEVRMMDDDIGLRLQQYGPSVQTKAEIVRRRIAKKDCIDRGWALVGFPKSGADFELLDKMSTPANRIVILNVSASSCKTRLRLRREERSAGAQLQPTDDEERNEDNELDVYYSEALAEIRAAAGVAAVEINAEEPIDKVQVKLQAAVIEAPAHDIEYCSLLRNACGD